MKNILICSAVALILAACDMPVSSSTSSGSSVAQSGEVVERESASSSQTVEVMDTNGFGTPVLAGTVKIPAAWRSEGGITWDRSTECVGNFIRVRWLASSPDAEESFEIMPGYSWQLAGTQIQMNPCPVLPVRSPREFLDIVAQRYPGARVIEYRDRPDLIAQSAPQENQQVQAHMEAGELKIAYQREGRQVQESLLAVLNITELQGNVMVGVASISAYRAPSGRMRPELSDRIRTSFKVDQGWMGMMQDATRQAVDQISRNQQARIASWHASEMGKINARGAAERSRIAMQTSREVAQIYSDTWANSQATDDRIQRRTLEAIGGYNTYADPRGGAVVRESIEYDRVMRTENGGYISTNDPYLNPAGSEELDRIP